MIRALFRDGSPDSLAHIQHILRRKTARFIGWRGDNHKGDVAPKHRLAEIGDSSHPRGIFLQQFRHLRLRHRRDAPVDGQNRLFVSINADNGKTAVCVRRRHGCP